MEIEKKFIEELYKIFEGKLPKKVCVLVSGGSDSMALLYLLNNIKATHDIEIFAITIDHKLRKESEEEALFVALFCKKLGINHKILTWKHEKLDSSIQEKAREARYQLASDFCKEFLINIAFTGHIFEDQVEQILISLSQGAGLYSFLIKDISEINNVKYVRPLLPFSKDELQKYLVQNNVIWKEDNSNKEPKYLRNKIRIISKDLIENSDKSRISTAISNIKRSSEALDKYSSDFIREKVYISNLGYGKVKIEELNSSAKEIAFSVLRKLLLIFGGRANEIRMDSVMNLHNSIKEKNISTLAGTIVFIENDYIYFVREFGRKMPNILEKDGIWDNRFRINNLNNFYIDRLSEKSYSENKEYFIDFDEELSNKYKKIIIHTLPCVFSLEKLIGIPHIYNNDQISENLGIGIEFLK